MSKKKSYRRWLQEQDKDQYVKQARQSHYRSRAVYKLQEIDRKDNLIKPDFSVVDLGSAPGSWSQYVSHRIGSDGRIIAVDMRSMIPIHGVHFIQGDFTEELIEQACLDWIGEHKIDLVISDIAPNLTGTRVTDQSRSMILAELVFSFCQKVLKSKGHFLIKLFEGVGTREYRKMLERHFDEVVIRKPSASRDKSREFYVVARSYRL